MHGIELEFFMPKMKTKKSASKLLYGAPERFVQARPGLQSVSNT